MTLFCIYQVRLFFPINTANNYLVMSQVDADFKLQDMKKLGKELELKEKGYKKRLADLQTALIKHMEQYVVSENTGLEWFIEHCNYISCLQNSERLGGL